MVSAKIETFGIDRVYNKLASNGRGYIKHTGYGITLFPLFLSLLHFAVLPVW